MAKISPVAKRLAEWRKILDGWNPKSDDLFAWFCGTITKRNADEVVRAAKFLGLDPKDPAHLAILLPILADILFRPNTKGRPRGVKKWDRLLLFALGAHRLAIEEEHPGISDQKAAKKLKLLPEYKHDSVESLRQRLSPARYQYALTLAAYRRSLESKRAAANELPVAGRGTPMRVLGL
jgi:hypothetical protein